MKMEKSYSYLEKIKTLQTVILDRMTPMTRHEVDSLSYWRERILFSIIFSGLLLGIFVISAVIPMAVAY